VAPETARLSLRWLDPRGTGGYTMTKPETPFPRHWLYYIILKYAVIAAAFLIALYVFYRIL
jgi:hypothetical protein